MQFAMLNASLNVYQNKEHNVNVSYCIHERIAKAAMTIVYNRESRSSSDTWSKIWPRMSSNLINKYNLLFIFIIRYLKFVFVP